MNSRSTVPFNGVSFSLDFKYFIYNNCFRWAFGEVMKLKYFLATFQIKVAWYVKLSEGSGVIKRVSLPFLFDSSRISNKLIGVLNFNILKISLKQWYTNRFRIFITECLVNRGLVCSLLKNSAPSFCSANNLTRAQVLNLSSLSKKKTIISRKKQ